MSVCVCVCTGMSLCVEQGERKKTQYCSSRKRSHRELYSVKKVERLAAA